MLRISLRSTLAGGCRIARRRGPTALTCVTLAVVSVVILGADLALATPGEARIRGQLDGLRVPFVANEGQLDARVAYYARTFAGTLFVTGQGELVYGLAGPTAAAPGGTSRTPSVEGWTLTERLVRASVQPTGQHRSATGVSSFIGGDRARWRAGLPAYEQVDLGEAWPGVTVTLRARGRSIEKVFTVAPGASVGRVRVRVRGARALSVGAAGTLVAHTGSGPVTFTAPVAYQERDGVRREVAVAYRVDGREYGFRVGAYDRNVPLVIDPLLQSTYLGGTDFDEPTAMAVHPLTGDVYVAGLTRSIDFPGTVGGARPTIGVEVDAFVARLNRGLTAVIQSTYLGGTLTDVARALAIDPATGDVYVAGFTSSTDFPGTAGGAQPTFVGGGSLNVSDPPADGFVVRLNSGLTVLTQATYFDFDGTWAESVSGLAIHPTTGDVYIAGELVTSFFAGPPDARFSPGSRGEAFVARLNAALTTRLQAVALGEWRAAALAVHPFSGDVYLIGSTHLTSFPGTSGGAQPTYGGGESDAVVVRLSGELAGPLQSTYLGGTSGDDGFAMAIHPATGDIYVTGITSSVDFPGTGGGAQPTKGSASLVDGFVARLDSGLLAITQATYLGGSDGDSARSVAIHPATGDVYVAGWTQSTDFPGTTGGAQPTYGGFGDTFVARLVASLRTLVQATYLGGTNLDSPNALALHPLTGDVYVAGLTFSLDLPGSGGGAQATRPGGHDGFVSRLTFGLAAEDPAFADVLPGDLFVAWIEALAASAITGGCAMSPPLYCPDASVTRGQMAVFLLRGIHGASYLPPAATHIFADVPPTHPFVTWSEELAREGITGGCATNPLRYCPDDPVTRGQMAVFLLRARHGAAYQPPPATGTMFVDVAPIDPYASWIEQLAREGITGGCTALRYCPDAVVTRAQMAVFLVRAFDLPM